MGFVLSEKGNKEHNFRPQGGPQGGQGVLFSVNKGKISFNSKFQAEVP